MEAAKTERNAIGSLTAGAAARGGRAVREGGQGGRGFSLMEVMIVIVIILLISGLVAVNLFGAKEDATKDAAQLQLNELKNGLKMFYLEFNRYPTVEEGVEVLWSSDTLDADAEESKWRKFFEEPTPTDPWNSEWGYTDESDVEGRGFELWSYGPDKEDGTEDDISVWSDSGEEGSDGAGLPPPPPAGN